MIGEVINGGLCWNIVTCSTFAHNQLLGFSPNFMEGSTVSCRRADKILAVKGQRSRSPWPIMLENCDM